MKRKIVIDKCGNCPYVDTDPEMMPIDKGYGDELFCNHDLNGNAPEKIESDTIPDWCQLEKVD